MDPTSSLAEYQRRLADRKAKAALLDGRSAQISNLRLLAFAGIAIVLWLALKGRVSPWWLIAPIAIFTAQVVWHDAVIRALAQAQRAITVYDWGIARIEDRWHSFGRNGDRFRQADHVYAEDLDIFGHQSLFQLLSTARTRIGEDKLAEWLRTPASIANIRARQQAIGELREQLDFRETLAVTGEEIPPELDPAKLLEWAEGPQLLHNPALRAVAPILAVAALAAIVIAFWKSFFLPVAAVVLAELLVHIYYRKRVQQVVASV